MSSRQLPANPAWSEAPPAQPSFVPVVPDIAERICHPLGISGPLEKLDTADSGICGYYCAPASKQHEALFIKLVNQQRATPLLAADRFARFVADHGIASACLIESYCKAIDDTLYALVYPYCAARFAQLQKNDLHTLGLTTGRLHQALARVPWQEQVRESAGERTALLHETQKRISEADPAIVPAAIINLLHECKLDYPDTGWSTQVIHGDLNYGNILFPVQQADMPCILDFEDTGLSWHSPLVDLAFVLERFVLMRCPDDKLAYQYASHVIDAYRDSYAQDLPALIPGSLIAVLRTLSLRAACLLLRLSLDNNPVVASEWDKFINLHAQTYQRSELIHKLEERASR
jgi:Ser/Thr protein kinase RdoA (MazF antagonist)